MKGGFQIFNAPHRTHRHDCDAVIRSGCGVPRAVRVHPQAVQRMAMEPCECYALTNGEPAVFVLARTADLHLDTSPHYVVQLREESGGLLGRCSQLLAAVHAQDAGRYAITREAGGWCFRPMEETKKGQPKVHAKRSD